MLSCYISNFYILYEYLSFLAFFSDQMFIHLNAVRPVLHISCQFFELFLLFHNCLSYSWFFLFYMNFRSSSMKCDEIVDYFVKNRHALDAVFSFVDILSLNLFSSLYFSKIFLTFSIRSCIFFNRLTPIYLTVHVVIMNGILKITIQNWLSLIILNVIDIFKCWSCRKKSSNALITSYCWFVEPLEVSMQTFFLTFIPIFFLFYYCFR